jgi:hypothetical protein
MQMPCSRASINSVGHHLWGRDRRGTGSWDVAATSPCCFVAMARHKGIAARARVGFATYFDPGWFIDHVVAEVWDEQEVRWRLVEPEIGDNHVSEASGVTVDPLDVAEDMFLTGSRVAHDEPLGVDVSRTTGASPR